MAGAASLAFVMTGAREGRAETVSVQGADGANAIDDDPDVAAVIGESVTATAGSTQPVTAPSKSAFARGGNGGNGGNDPGNGAGEAGGSATATAATTLISGSAEADATAIGGTGGNFGAGGYENFGYGGSAGASSTAVTRGSGDASSSANATGGDQGYGDFGIAGDGYAVADATAAGGGKAVATASATGGLAYSFTTAFGGLAYATSNAETVNGAMADAQSIAIPGADRSPIFGKGQASSTAKTSFAGPSVESTTTATTGTAPGLAPVAASTHATAEGGSGQAFPGETAYAFSTGLPDKAYATTLIDGASNVASALLGPEDAVFGTAILGANYAPDGGGASLAYSASSTFDFVYRGDLLLGLIGDQVSGFAGRQGFQSIEFTIVADGVEILDKTFMSLAAAESFFRDDVIDLGSDLGPSIDLTFGYTLVADGSGGFGFDFAMGARSPSPRPGR
jgi:hypothetical protein